MTRIYSGRRFKQAIRYFLFGRAAQAVTSFALTLWLVRLFAPADYGAYMILWGMVEMMVPLTSFGMLEAVRRYLPDLAARGAPGALHGFVRWMTLIRLALMALWAIVIAFFWVEIATWLGFSVMQQEASTVAVCLVISVIGFRYAAEMLECLLEQRWSQLTQALMPIGRLLGVSILVATDRLTLVHMFWVDIVVSVSCFMLAEFFLMRRLKGAAAGDYLVSKKEVMTFAWHMAGVNVFSATASYGALRLLVARFLGLEAAGLFAFLQQLLMIVGRYLPANLLANMIRPMLIARYGAGDTAVFGQGMALMWKTNLLIVFGCVAAFAVAGDAIIALVSGGRFPQAGLVMLLLFLGLGATTQGQLVSMAMQILNQARELRNLSVLLLLVPAAVWVGARYGLVGVALGIVIAQWFRNSIALWWMRSRGISFAGDWRGVAMVAGTTLAVMAAGLLVSSEYGAWPSLVFVMLMFPVGMLLAKPLVGSDMELLRRGLRKWARYLAPFCRAN